MATTLAYQKRDSPMHALNPLTPALFAVCVTVLGLTVNSAWVLFGVFFLTLGLIIYARVFPVFIRMFLAISLPIAIPMLLIHGFLYPNAQTILWRWGPLSLRKEGLLFAISVISRLFSMISAYFLLVMTAHPRDLVVALESRKVSPKVGYLILSTLQLIPYIQRTAETILDAQRSRGLRLGGSLWNRFKSYVPLISPVVMGSISALEIRAMALEVRGFNLTTPRNYLHQVKDTPRDALIRRLNMIATALVIVGYYGLRFFR
jgi:energy-coupling factor transport system permease protein